MSKKGCAKAKAEPASAKTEPEQICPDDRMRFLPGCGPRFFGFAHKGLKLLQGEIYLRDEIPEVFWCEFEVIESGCPEEVEPIKAVIPPKEEVI